MSTASVMPDRRPRASARSVASTVVLSRVLLMPQSCHAVGAERKNRFDRSVRTTTAAAHLLAVTTESRTGQRPGSRAHGYARYRLDGCRCHVCGWARSEYDRRRDQAIRDGAWQPFVDIAEARAHIARLQAIGYGDRSIAALAGVERRVVGDIRLGRRRDSSRGNPPLARVRAATAASILAVDPTSDQLPDGALTDAAPTWVLIDDLLRRGWSKAAIAREAGLGRSIQLRRERVTVRNARRIERVHEAATSRGLDVTEVEHLAGSDSAENIARRLGYGSARTLDQLLHRAGRPDLARRLQGRAAV